jgi:predicted NUDIX family NTP pyrophosphohydrolase
MPAKQSAGILLHRLREGVREVFLVHPGGPFYVRKDDGVWSIPKGEFDTEDPQVCALREFEEETGHRVRGEMKPLTPVRQRAGKTVLAWAMEGDCDASVIHSNTFPLEWPPKSGRMQEFPEVDRAGWFPLEEARRKIMPAQQPLLDELEATLR